MTKKLAKCVFAFFLVCLFLAPNLGAQSPSTGALTGTIKDTTGAVVPNATVTATSAATGQVRTTNTGGDGTYTLGLLPPGTYRLKFEAAGFKSIENPAVTVTVTQTGTLDQTLEVGSQTQEVTIQGNVETIQTANASVGSTIAGQTVTDLPLAARNYTNLLSLSAGANATVTNAAALGKNTQATAVNGSNTSQNNYQMDGASIVSYTGVGGVTEGGSRGAFGIPNPDSIQEFRIQTSQYDAGYGRNPGANVNVVTKSGTNDFHGNAFEYFRNTVLNANDWFLKESEVKSDQPNTRAPLDQNQYGGTFGGPVKKDKLFFFVSYQGTSQKNGQSPYGLQTSNIPYLPGGNRGTCPSGASAIVQCDATAQLYAASLGALYAGKFGQQGGVAINPTGSNINPTALQILQLKIGNGAYYIPSPPLGGGVASPGVTCLPVAGANANSVGTGLCTAIAPAIYHEYQGIGNWDYVINSKNTLSGRYFFSTDPSKQQFYQGSDTIPGSGVDPQFGNQTAVLRLTTIVSSNLVNEARFSYQRNVTVGQPTTPFSASEVGMTALAPATYDLLPRIQIGSLNFGTAIFSVTNNTDNQFQWADQISWTHGKQTVRAGFEVGHVDWNWNFIGLENGYLIVSTPADFLLGLPGCAPGTLPAACTASETAGTTNGTSFSNVGSTSNTGTRYTGEGFDFHFYTWTYDGFVQDDIKLTSHLTLNVGVRWENDGYPYERTGKNVNIDPELALTNPVPLVAAPCPHYPAPCAGSSLIGMTVPSNFNTNLYGAIPAGVFQTNSKAAVGHSSPLDNFAPRLGFAWQPLATNKFVIRGGVGMFYDLIGGENFIHGALQSMPYGQTVGQGGPNNYFSTLQVPYASTPANWFPRYVTATGLTSGITQNVIEQNFPTPLTYQYNLQAQYEFLPSWVLEVGYVGSRGIHQTAGGSYPINPAFLQNAAVTGLPPVTGNSNLRVPLLGYASTLAAYADNEDTHFNSAQVTVRKNFSRGLTLGAAYTWSSALVSAWAPNGAITGATVNPTWSMNPIISQYGANPNYHPQRFTLNYSYDLPFGQHQGWVGVVTGGWRVSGETTIQDGTPLTMTDSGYGTIFGQPITSYAEFAPGASNGNAQNPGSIQSRIIAGQLHNGQGYLNAAAFCPSNIANACRPVISNGFGFGNSGQGITLGPPQNNWDISISKITRVGGIRESATLEFRTEFFDAFNHPQFSNPSVGVNNEAGFGQITSLSVNPRLIQFALKYAF